MLLYLCHYVTDRYPRQWHLPMAGLHDSRPVRASSLIFRGWIRLGRHCLNTVKPLAITDGRGGRSTPTLRRHASAHMDARLGTRCQLPSPPRSFTDGDGHDRSFRRRGQSSGLGVSG